MRIKSILLFVFTTFVLSASAQQYVNPIVIIDTLTPQELVADTLISGCVTASNITFAGASTQIGYFYCPDSCSFDTIMHSGIVMASGQVTNAIGPNTSSGITGSMSMPGDADLDALIPQSTHDAAVLEFDFIPSSDTLQFKYSFGSDEYLEYVNSSFNDIFAFFLSGPNPLGGAYVNQNIAIVPGTTTPVSINNVNTGSYSQYYINNGTGSSPNGEALEYDGYTIGMYAAASVIACETYHIKLAVADAGDSVLDSGVFIESGSFTDGTSVTINNVNPAGTMNDLYEGCESYYVFTRNDTNDVSFPVDIQLAFSGTATLGSDITSFPSVVTIPIGAISDTVYYTAFMDGIQESTETFIIEILAGCPCDPTPASDTITIYDYIEFKAGIINTDSMFCGITPPATYDIVSTCVSHPAWFITYLWNTGSTDSIITVVPPLPGHHDIYWVAISDLCGNTIIDSITIGVSELSGVSITATDALCFGACNGTVNATPLGTSSNIDFIWSEPSIGTTYTGVLNNLCAGYYSVTVTDDSYCEFSDDFFIDEPSAALDPSSGIITVDTAFCDMPGQITLEASANIPDVTYAWNGAAVTTNTLDVVPSVGINAYTVAISDFCGYTIIDTVNIYVSQVQNSFLNYENTSCYGVCDGSVSVLTPSGIPPFIYQWGSNNSGSFTTSESTLDSLCADTFNLNVIDAINCLYIADMIIEQPDSFNAELSGIVSTDTMWCGTTPPPTIGLEASSNIQDVNYLWSTGETTQGIFFSPAQGNSMYWVTISDNCGNSKVDSVHVIVSNMSGVNIITDTCTCFNSCDGFVQVNPIGGIVPYTYNWSNGIGSASSNEISTLCKGNYSITISDDGGCLYQSDFVIGGPDSLSQCNITNQATMFCGVNAPASITLETEVNTEVSYSWNTGITTETLTFNPVTGANIYWVDFTDNCGNTYRDTIIISVSNFSGAQLVVDSTDCYNSCTGEVDVTAIGGITPYSYEWDVPGVSSSTDSYLDNLCAGVYHVTVSDLALCNIVKEFTVIEPDSITFGFISQDSHGQDCNGFASAVDVLGGTAPYSYLWDDNAATATYNVMSLCPGLYQVIVSDSHNCTSQDTIRILDTTVGIDELGNNEVISIYPNPNKTGQFFINLSEINSNEVELIKVLDSSGKLITTFANDGITEMIELKDISAGINVLQIFFKNGKSVTRKLVVIE